MRAITTTVGPLTASSTNNIATSQSLAGAGALNLNGTLASGGVATITNPQRIGIASAGNDSGLTWTIAGTNAAGNTISETLTGGNIATVNSVMDYKTVTSIKGSAATASTVTVGTTGTGASPWVRSDEWGFGPTSIQFEVTGSATYTLQGSSDDPNDPVYLLNNPVAPSAMVWDQTVSSVVNATTSQTIGLVVSPLWLRVYLSAGTGSVLARVVQTSEPIY